jgi:predicted enzyme related to lactoylglutathione lyase
MVGPRVTKSYFMLLVADMDRAVRFYSDAFGGEVAFTSQEWSELTVAGASVALHAGDMGADTRTGLGVEAEDLEPALMTLTAAGGRVMSPPRDRQGKRVRLARVADIEGNPVTVGQADR